MRLANLISACVASCSALTATNVAVAAHDCRRVIHEEFNANFHRLNVDFEARKRSLHQEHRASRECVLRDLRRAERLYCGEQRAAIVRELHCKLRDIDRRHHHAVRTLHREVEAHRDGLRRDRDFALRACRNRCTGACGSVRLDLPAESFGRRLPHSTHDFARRRAADVTTAPGYPGSPLSALLWELLGSRL